jgi:hypothetical protein
MLSFGELSIKFGSIIRIRGQFHCTKFSLTYGTTSVTEQIIFFVGYGAMLRRKMVLKWFRKTASYLRLSGQKQQGGNEFTYQQFQVRVIL